MSVSTSSPRILGRAMAVATLASGLLVASGSAMAQAQTSILIGAYIDGRDHLVIQGDRLSWYHIAFAAVGRHGGVNAATVVQAQDWNLSWLPRWPEPPPNEIRFEAWSSTGVAPTVMVPKTEARWHVTKYIGPGPVRVVAQPTASNGYNLVVDFNDNVIAGPTYYWVKLSTAMQVVIDLRPADRSNALNPKATKTIQVAILSELLPAGFDATTIDPSTVKLGPADASPVAYTLKDVNGDGYQDAVASFRIDSTGITCGDSYVELTAETVGGETIEGRDVLRTGRCD
jgi:hypothetical protein